MISNKNLSIHFKTVNYTLFFVLFLIIISNFPHDPQPIESWVNCSLYFLIFWQSCFLIKNSTQNKSLLFNIALFALFHSLSFIVAYMGENLLFGLYTTWSFFVYFSIFQTFLFVLSSIFIWVKYYSKNSTDLFSYLFSFLLIIPVFLWFFFPFIIHPQAIFSLENSQLDKIILKIEFLPLIFIIWYGVLVYKYDRSLGEHINTIMVCFFIMTIMDITNLFGSVYDIMIFSFTQYVLTLTLTFFVVTSFRLINHVCSTFGQFYDILAITGNSYGVPIKRKKSASVSFLSFAKAYFHQRRNTVGFLTLLFIFCINFFTISVFVKINLAVLSFGVLIIFYFLTALYQKRLTNGYLLTFKRIQKV